MINENKGTKGKELNDYKVPEAQGATAKHIDHQVDDSDDEQFLDANDEYTFKDEEPKKC